MDRQRPQLERTPEPARQDRPDPGSKDATTRCMFPPCADLDPTRSSQPGSRREYMFELHPRDEAGAHARGDSGQRDQSGCRRGGAVGRSRAELLHHAPAGGGQRAGHADRTGVVPEPGGGRTRAGSDGSLVARCNHQTADIRRCPSAALPCASFIYWASSQTVHTSRLADGVDQRGPQVARALRVARHGARRSAVARALIAVAPPVRCE
jgi:hypothetical protein